MTCAGFRISRGGSRRSRRRLEAEVLGDEGLEVGETPGKETDADVPVLLVQKEDTSNIQNETAEEIAGEIEGSEGWHCPRCFRWHPLRWGRSCRPGAARRRPHSPRRVPPERRHLPREGRMSPRRPRERPHWHSQCHPECQAEREGAGAALQAGEKEAAVGSADERGGATARHKTEGAS